MPDTVLPAVEMIVVNAGGTITVQPRTVLDALGLLNESILDIKSKVDGIGSAYHYCGTVADEQHLPTTDLHEGDVYNIEAASTYGGAGTNVAWTGTEWDSLGSTVSIPVATEQDDGLMSSTDKAKLNGIESGANAYSLPAATSSSLGGVKVGQNLSIADGVLSATDTTYTPSSASPAMDGTAAAGSSTDYARADHVHPTDTSRAAASHSHAASDITSGTLDIARIPTGTTGTTVALGNHTHSGYATASSVPDAGSVSSTGLMSIKHGNTTLFTVQLPVYVGGAS